MVSCVSRRPASIASVEAFYERALQTPSAITAHLPRLRALADGLELAVEFGVKRGASSSALLLGAARVMSFDIVATPEARLLQQLAGDRWDYRLEDSRTAEIPEVDLILFDSLHTFDQLEVELARHGHRSRRYLVFHDVTTFGEVGAVGETGRQAWTYTAGGGSVPRSHWGIRPAIDAWQVAHDEWRIAERCVDSHGLLVLERRP